MSVKPRWKVALGIAAIAAGAYVAVGALQVSEPPPPASSPRAETPTAAPPASPPSSPPRTSTAEPQGEDSGVDFVRAATADVLAAQEEPAAPYPVDLERLRVKLPDNLFWELGTPTKDPQVLQKRAEAERQRNELFGKVQSGEATEEEIHRYYEHRRKLSEDYLALAQGVLSEYGSALPERDRGLYELSIRMHTTRLEEIPRQTAEALERSQATARRQREWKQRGNDGN